MPSKSTFVLAVDAIQGQLRPYLKSAGFRARGRTFNRLTADGLTQVINLQMSAVDPPGANPIRWLRQIPRGMFTVNLGIHVPEVTANHGAGRSKSWVQEYDCCIRSCIGELVDSGDDLWWPASDDPSVHADVRYRVEADAIPFLERFRSRDLILSELAERSDTLGGGGPARIVCAIILAGRGNAAAARSLLLEQVKETRNSHPQHADYVRELAGRLKLGRLDG